VVTSWFFVISCSLKLLRYIWLFERDNFLSLVMATSRARSINCKVHPLVVSTILDAHIRRQEGNEKCIGALMGFFEGNCLVISDAFMVLHKENQESGTISIDKEYHRKMVTLKKKVCPTENVVGWFVTCDDVEPSFVLVHNFFGTPSESRFASSQLLPSPVVLTVDPTLSNGDLNIKVSVMQTTVGADSLVQFHQLPMELDERSMPVLQYIQRFSEIEKASDSTLQTDLETVISQGTNLEDVSLALQVLRNTAVDSTSVSELKELVGKHLSLVSRVAGALEQSSQDLVI
jgi:translation initiation factor 3 subunit F